MRWVYLSVLLIPLIDALLLVPIATQIGFAPTVLLVVLTGLIGMLLVRAEGRYTIRKLRDRLQRGELPAEQVFDGALLLVAAAFLLTPGVVTDALGFLLVIPITRGPIRRVLQTYVVSPYIDRELDGLLSGQIYVGGVPGGNPGGPGAPGPGPGGPGPGGPGPGPGPGPGSRGSGGSDDEFDPDDATSIDFNDE
ncbi:MAG: FxsA family protein [Halococcoides sp.]